MAQNKRVLSLYVSIQHLPTIWRRFQLPLHLTVGSLHHILQTAFGWGDHGGHAFHRPSGEGPDTLTAEQEDELVLEQLLRDPGATLAYVYGRAEDWTVEIRSEGLVEPARPDRFFFCTGGELSGPPEDCGGVEGYLDLMGGLEDDLDGDPEDTDPLDDDPDLGDLAPDTGAPSYDPSEGAEVIAHPATHRPDPYALPTEGDDCPLCKWEAAHAGAEGIVSFSVPIWEPYDFHPDLLNAILADPAFTGELEHLSDPDPKLLRKVGRAIVRYAGKTPPRRHLDLLEEVFDACPSMILLLSAVEDGAGFLEWVRSLLLTHAHRPEAAKLAERMATLTGSFLDGFNHALAVTASGDGEAGRAILATYRDQIVRMSDALHYQMCVATQRVAEGDLEAAEAILRGLVEGEPDPLAREPVVRELAKVLSATGRKDEAQRLLKGQEALLQAG